MRFTESDEIESELYDEFLAIDLTEQKEFGEYNRAKKTTKRRLKDSVSTFSKIYNNYFHYATN